MSVVEFHPQEAPAWAGPAPGVVLADVESRPLDAAAIERLVETSAAGACVTFVGRVRDHDGGRSVARLTYSSHPNSQAEARRISEEVLAVFTGVRAVALSHRVGTLNIGDVAIVCAVSADHRAQAFDACRSLVERIKAELPIWKHQVFVDGSEVWVGSA